MLKREGVLCGGTASTLGVGGAVHHLESQHSDSRGRRPQVQGHPELHNKPLSQTPHSLSQTSPQGSVYLNFIFRWLPECPE